MNFLPMFLDQTIIFWLQAHLISAALTPVLQFFSALGSLGAIWIVFGLVLLARKKYRRAGMAVFIALFFSLLVGNGILKHLVMRTRPCFDYPWVPLLVNRPAVNDFSFPSGHTFGSFATATAMYPALGREKALAAFLLAIIIGFSRLYFFLHYPSDVFAGALLGLGFGSLAWYLAGIVVEKGSKVLQHEVLEKVNTDAAKENAQIPMAK